MGKRAGTASRAALGTRAWRLAPLTVIAAALVCAAIGRDLVQPPVWDEAFSVMPSAWRLSDPDFGLGELAGLPDYHEGGFGTHGSSLVTLGTAAVLSAVSDPAVAHPLLHVLHALVAGFGLAALALAATPALGRGGAALLVVAVLLQPAFLVQAGRLYLEIPAFAAAAAALLAWSRGHRAAALAACLVAAGIKESGVVAPVALAMASCFEAGPAVRRAARAFAFLGTAVAGTILLSVARSDAVSQELFRFSLLPRFGEYLVLNAERYLFTAPDLPVLLGLALLLAVVRPRWSLAGLRAPADALSPDALRARSRAVCALFVAAAVGFHGLALPLVGGYFQLLTRYLVVPLPFALLLLADGLAVRAGRRVTIAALAITALAFVLNAGGALYPELPAKFGNDMSIAERSRESRELVALQRDAIAELQRVAVERPVFYELPVHFLVREPRLGYVAGPLSDGHCVQFEEPWRQGRLEDYPDRFAALYLSPWLGGAVVRELAVQARRDPRWHVDDSRVLRRGPFVARLLFFERRQPARLAPSGGGAGSP